MKSREEILKKIKKILDIAKGKTTNVNVAATAMRQAQKMMAEHSIQEHELDEEAITHVQNMKGRWAINVYRTRLAHLVSSSFGVDWCLQDQKKFVEFRLKTDVGLMFIGPRMQIELASYAYDVLLTQLERDRRRYLSRVRKAKNRASRGDVFGVGWVESAAEVLEKFAGKDRSIDIQVYMARQLNVVAVAPVKVRDGALTHNDRFSGRESGKKAALHRPMAGRSARLALPGATQ